jgi:O-antigen ligase
VIVVALMFIPSAFDPVVERFDDRVLQKTESDSFAGRSEWTAVSLQAAFDSNLLGVGLGSTRASNYLVSVLASTGLLGFVLYFGFVCALLSRSTSQLAEPERILIRAMRWSYVPVLILQVLVGTTPDIGVMGALRWGIVVSVLAPLSSLNHASVSQQPMDRGIPVLPLGRADPGPGSADTTAGTPHERPQVGLVHARPQTLESGGL